MKIFEREHLADDIRLFAWVLIAFAADRDAGHIPMNRAAPTGGERIVYSPTPFGFATFYEVEGRMWLDLLHVERSARGAGLGSALLAAVLERCKGKRVELGTFISNQPMRSIARTAGFKEEGLLLSIDA